MGLNEDSCASNELDGDNMTSISDAVIQNNFYDLVIVGNGPAAIILSYFLSGNWPYYNGKPVDHPVLQDKLDYVSQQKSLVLEDLDWLSEGLFDSRSFNPVSILFDQMNKPNADMLTKDESLLEWRHSPAREVRHLVVGLGAAGGSWHRMDNSQRSVSLSHWLELPGYTFQQWLNLNQDMVKQPDDLPALCEGVHKDRLCASYFGLYYQDYVERMGLSRNFVNNVYVNNLQQMSHGCHHGYKIEGVQYYAAGKQPFVAFAGNVALACGSLNRPRLLHVQGEDRPFVHHKLPQLSSFCDHKPTDPPVLVVGCGLVALDSVLSLMQNGVSVVHAFRRDARDPAIILNQLSPAYADYLVLKPLMQGQELHALYTPLPQHAVAEIHVNKTVTLQSTQHQVTLSVSSVVVQIGSLPDLRFMERMGNLYEESTKEFHLRTNPMDVDLLTMESTKYKGLYAMGPLVGDNFVRFLLGGALAITSGLFRPDGYMDGKCCGAASNVPSVIKTLVAHEDGEGDCVVKSSKLEHGDEDEEEDDSIDDDESTDEFMLSSADGFMMSKSSSEESLGSEEDSLEESVKKSVKGLYEYLDPISLIDPNIALVAGQ